MSYGKADIHIHTCFSDGFHEPEEIVNYVVAHTDLRVIAITDHDTLAGAKQAYDYWRRHRAAFGALEVIKGAEISSKEGHILGLCLYEEVPPHMSAADTVRAIQEQGGLAIAAHPFTHLLPFTDLKGIGRQIAELPLDGVETLNSVPTELYANRLTALYNRRHRNHPAVGGSDTHFLTMVGQTYTWFAGQTAEDFRQSMLHGCVKPGGRVNGPMLLPRVLLYLLRRSLLSCLVPGAGEAVLQNPGLQMDIIEMRQMPGAIVCCAGQLVRDNAGLLKDEVVRLIESGITRLVVDLARVTWVDSTGLGALIAAHRLAGARGGNVVLCSPSLHVQHTLQMIGLDKVLGVYATPQEAVQALK